MDNLWNFNKFKFLNDNIIKEYSEFNQYQMDIGAQNPLGPGFGFATDPSLSIYGQDGDSPYTDYYSRTGGSINRLNKFDEIINKASKSFNIDKNLIRSVILTESAANPKAISSANAKGLMQLIDSTAADMNVKNVWNPEENIFGGTKYLSKMLEQFDGDLDKSLAGYNAGPGNVQKYDGVPPFEETKNYINRVKGYMKYWENKL